MPIIKRTCPNGHKYDGNIYGDNCPFCPSSTNATIINDGGAGSNERTRINGADSGDAPTIPMGGNNIGGGASAGGHTVIRIPGREDNGLDGRRIVGLLVSYSLNPTGEVFHLYEGRNIIGRDATCDIVFNSSSVSGKHLVIVYYAANNSFVMQDQLSSNGTYVNGAFIGDNKHHLKSGDIVVIGAVKFVFLAVPEGM